MFAQIIEPGRPAEERLFQIGARRHDVGTALGKAVQRTECPATHMECGSLLPLFLAGSLLPVTSSSVVRIPVCNRKPQCVCRGGRCSRRRMRAGKTIASKLARNNSGNKLPHS